MAAALFMASGAFAEEQGDFNATLRGVTIGIPTGAMPPPGLYGGLETFTGWDSRGTGQITPQGGANGGLGATVTGQAIIPSLLWSTGWNLFGGNVGLVVIQPFYDVLGWDTNCPVPGTTCTGQAPFALNTGVFNTGGSGWEQMHNTIFQAIDSWNWKNGWFTSLGIGVQGPDGSTYNGTLNQDYWTISPLVGISYIDKNWKASANFLYDIHTASAGHTGFYAGVQQATAGVLPVAAPNGCIGFNCPGIGYTSGEQLFIDWSAAYRWGKLEFGPVGYFKLQTTSDSPGSGYTCATMANKLTGAGPGATYGNMGLACSRDTDIALGGLLGYDFGPAELEVYFTDSVYTKNDFAGPSIFTRLSFKLSDPSPQPPAAAPMVGKSH
jgi:hypothetical protein